jgi:hypothetical protein
MWKNRVAYRGSGFLVDCGFVYLARVREDRCSARSNHFHVASDPAFPIVWEQPTMHPLIFL